MAKEETTEVRVQMPNDMLRVIDGYCNAKGMDRTTVIREVLGTWSEEKLHVATVICRVAGVNPMALDKGRHV